MNQPFQLPDMALDTPVKVKAKTFLGDDGYTLLLGGVEVTSDSLTVRADQLTYKWATGEIEPLGNVRLKPAQK